MTAGHCLTPNNDFNIETNSVAIDTINKVGAFRQYSLNASVGTTIYGTVNFKEGSKIQSIRHTLRPNISYSNRPSFEKYYDTYIIDAEGNTAEYTRFENSLFGVPSRGISNAMSISLGNNFEAKVRDDTDSTSTEPKKIVFSQKHSTEFVFDHEPL